jgi:hypothetical protein
MGVVSDGISVAARWQRIKSCLLISPHISIANGFSFLFVGHRRIVASAGISSVSAAGSQFYFLFYLAIVSNAAVV